MIKRILNGKKSKKAPAEPVLDLSVVVPDSTPFERELIQQTAQTTMTSPERLLALIRAVEYVVTNQIEGDVVECGVWRGGSMFAAARSLLHFGDWSRRLWLYDTFEGMSIPTERDVDMSGVPARELLINDDIHDPKGVWCLSTLEEVKKHLEESCYPEKQICYIEGKVEQTLPETTPEKISILRLDTDWYESTRCELEYLFPLLSSGGILIIDDYGHWQGCRKAVNEYFSSRGIRIFLSRIDYTGRIAIKQ